MPLHIGPKYVIAIGIHLLWLYKRGGCHRQIGDGICIPHVDLTRFLVTPEFQQLSLTMPRGLQHIGGIGMEIMGLLA